MPFTLFCHEGTPDDAHAFFDENNALLSGDSNNWDASYEFPGKWLRKKKTISFNYEREWCSPPNWPTQLMGMQNYVAEFELTDETRSTVMPLIRQFRFSIGIIAEPEIASGDDPRLEVINALAEHMNGILFTPGALLDANFRPFAAADGDCDPDAVIPLVPAETSDEESSHKHKLAVEPPGPGRVVQRLYVLLSIAARGLLDMNLASGNIPAYRLSELHDWIDAIGIEQEFEDDERRIVYTAETKLSQQDAINSVWRLEGLAVLAWALQFMELPHYDCLVETDDLLKALSLLDVPMSQQKLASPELRDRSELETYNEQVWAFNWRMVDFRVRPKAVDYANVDFGQDGFDLSWATLVDGDLSVQGTQIAQADPNLVSTMISAAVERHRASNWLEGHATLYSQADTNT